MTKSKYILIIVTFFALLTFATSFFCLAVYIREKSDVLCYVFLSFFCICIIADILLLVFNNKKLDEFRAESIAKMASKLDFTVVETNIDFAKLYEKLNSAGYVEVSKNTFTTAFVFEYNISPTRKHRKFATIMEENKKVDILKYTKELKDT